MKNKKQVFSVKCSECNGTGKIHYKKYSKRITETCVKCEGKGFYND